MKTVDKTQLKANLLELLKIVELQGEEILVTEGTKPVARISPYQKSYSTAELFKNMRLIYDKFSKSFKSLNLALAFLFSFKCFKLIIININTIYFCNQPLLKTLRKIVTNSITTNQQILNLS